MAGKNAARKRSVKANRRQKGRRNGRVRQSTRSTGYGGLIARGVRTLLSVLPGSTLTTGIADFVFKSLGYTSSLEGNLNKFAADIKVTALTANFHIAAKDILFDSYTHGCKTDLVTWASNYQAGRVRSVTIKVVPETPMGEVRGILGLAFIPFRNQEENTWYDSHNAGVLIEQLKRIPGAKTGPAGKPLSITFRPGPSDGDLNFDVRLAREIGAVLIAFDQTSRDAYGMFTADQFSAMVYVSGIIELRRPQEEPYTIKYTRTIDDKMRTAAGFVKRPSDPKFYRINGTAEDHHSFVRLIGSMPESDYEVFANLENSVEQADAALEDVDETYAMV